MNHIIWEILNLFGNGASGGTASSNDRIVFRETFVGDGVDITFQLDGTIGNASFAIGGWDAVNVSNLLPSHVTRDDNNEPTYDSLIPLIRNRVDVVSISVTGLVTLNFPPRSGVSFRIWYWYDLDPGEKLADYFREEYVAEMESERGGDPRQFTVMGGRNNANVSNQYLDGIANVPMNLNSIRLPYNARLIKFTSSTEGVETFTAELRKNDSVTIITSNSHSASIFETSNLNINFDADDEVQFFVNGMNIGRPIFVAVFEQR